MSHDHPPQAVWSGDGVLIKRILKVGRLPIAIVRRLRDAKMDERHAHLNDLMVPIEGLRQLAFFLVLFGGLFLGFAIGLASARGEEIHDHAKLGAAGELYAKWMIPNGGRPRHQSCCNQNDCYATAIKNMGGTWFALKRETRKWIPIPESKLEELQPDEVVTPDGQSHLCSPPTSDSVYCALRGDGI